MRLLNHAEEKFDSTGKIAFVHNDYDILLEDLRKIEDKFYKVFDLNPCPMSISDATGKIIDVNESFIRTIGLNNKSDIIGKSTIDLKIIKEKDALSALSEIEKNGELKNYLCTFKTKHGRKRGFFSGSIITLNNKEYIFLICNVVNSKCILNIFKTYVTL